MVSHSENDTSVLDDRYGRGHRTRTRQRRLAWLVGGVFAVIFGAWVVWAGLDAAGPAIDARNTAHSVVDDRTVTVTFELSAPPGTGSYCAVQALNDTFAVVGWKVVEVPASEERTRTITETLTTVEEASTGLIYRCWLA